MHSRKFQQKITLILTFLFVQFGKITSEKVIRESSSSCGGRLQASNGTISYKNFSPYAPNERCVWTVRVVDAASYHISLDRLGDPGTLIITGLGLGGAVRHEIPYYAPANIDVPITNVMVITFSTAEINSNKSMGFSLRYYAFEGNYSAVNSTASVSSEDILAPANLGHIKYPSNGPLYGNLDLSVIVIVPPFGVQNPLNGKTEVVYIRSGLQGQWCQDNLSVYGFRSRSGNDSYTHNEWNLLGRLCGGVDSEFISSHDLIMIIFESDYNEVSSGFHLYTRYVEEICSRN